MNYGRHRGSASNAFGRAVHKTWDTCRSVFNTVTSRNFLAAAAIFTAVDGIAFSGEIGHTIGTTAHKIATQTFIPNGFMSQTPATYKTVGKWFNMQAEDALWAVSLGTVDLEW